MDPSPPHLEHLSGPPGHHQQAPHQYGVGGHHHQHQHHHQQPPQQYAQGGGLGKKRLIKHFWHFLNLLEKLAHSLLKMPKKVSYPKKNARLKK